MRVTPGPGCHSISRAGQGTYCGAGTITCQCVSCIRRDVSSGEIEQQGKTGEEPCPHPAGVRGLCRALISRRTFAIPVFSQVPVQMKVSVPGYQGALYAGGYCSRQLIREPVSRRTGRSWHYPGVSFRSGSSTRSGWSPATMCPGMLQALTEMRGGSGAVQGRVELPAGGVVPRGPSRQVFRGSGLSERPWYPRGSVPQAL